MELPHSAASERNKGPILEVLLKIIETKDKRLIEIGAGTGQHAVYFAPKFPWLEWHPTDLGRGVQAVNQLMTEVSSPNLKKAIRLDVNTDDFPKLKFDLVYSANTLHIMPWKTCKTFMKLMGQRLREGSRVILYGPFKYQGEFTSESNAQFDQSLKETDPNMGIRAFEDIVNAMAKNGFELLHDFEMPANNRTLVFKRLKFEA
jgi:cyclopropane fatty-acyl-phospholipid synthase-like methyltransferase